VKKNGSVLDILRLSWNTALNYAFVVILAGVFLKVFSSLEPLHELGDQIMSLGVGALLALLLVRPRREA